MQFKTIQRIVEVFIVIILLIGIFWLIFGSILYNKNKDISEASEQNAIRAGFILAITFGCFLILWGILGLIAACKKLNCLLGVYNVGIFFVLLISLTILGIAIAVAAKLPDYKDDKNCTEQTFLRELKDLNYNGVKTLCQSKCECQFKGTPAEALSQGILSYNSNSGETKVQDCSYYDKDDSFDDLRGFSGLLRSVEETFDCSGICTKNSYYVFSNVNNGKPNKDCKVEVIDYLDTNINRFLQASVVISFIMLLSFIFSCCLQCKKPEGEHFYERTGQKKQY